MRAGGLALLWAVAAGAYEPHINYMLQCMGCHAPDGRGEPGHVPAIRSTLLPLARNADGRRFMVQVPGAALSKLSDAELAQLLNWMVAHLSAQQHAQFAPFTAQEVTRYRATPLVDVTDARRRLVRQLDVPQ